MARHYRRAPFAQEATIAFWCHTGSAQQRHCQEGFTVDTRTIAIAALVIAVVVVLILVL
jgi:hypothetical protein